MGSDELDRIFAEHKKRSDAITAKFAKGFRDDIRRVTNRILAAALITTALGAVMLALSGAHF